MILTFDEFKNQLGQVLHHLYDPSLRPPPSFWQVLGYSPEKGLDALQTAIIQAIEDMRPSDHVPKTARSWRLYSALYYRFVSNLTQEEVAERVSITTRHLRREQTSAIHLLAVNLWAKAQLPPPEETEQPQEREEPLSETSTPSADIPGNPETQLRNDLLALQESAPGVVSDVPQVIRSVLTLAEKYPSARSLPLRTLSLPAELKASLHPSALRQVLWLIVRQAIEQHQIAELTIHCGDSHRRAVIELTFSPPFTFEEQRMETIREILEVQNGSLSTSIENDRLSFRIELLLVDRTILVVDDNPDIVHLYQRYLVGTPYYLVHLAKGQEVFEQLNSIQPDIIILDIMLPDMDGWDLLTRLTELPETRGIPVIICSVVCDPELALALGAKACLAKPIQRPEFIRALDRVANRS